MFALLMSNVLADCPSLSHVLQTPKLIRWEVWNDPTCSGPCFFDKCDGNLYPCCVKSRPTPNVVPGQSRCAADGNTYSCLEVKCHYVRPCASDPGLLHCSCQPPTHEMIMDPKYAAEMAMISPCLKVEVGKPLGQWYECEAYLNTQLVLPRQGCRWVIPKTVHSMGKTSDPNMETKMIMSANSGFKLRHMGDRAARRYVARRCGEVMGRAYDCFIAPAFRADLARYCILWSEGGVYVDSDMVLTKPIEQVVDMCGGATVGEDIPQVPPPQLIKRSVTGSTPQPGKQMKILAGEAKHPLFRCMIDRILNNVKARAVPAHPLALTGPQLLHKCYIDMVNQSTIYVTYRDTRGAKWPYTGMMGKAGHLAFETTKPEHYQLYELMDNKGGNRALKANHYHELYLEGKVYTDTCDV